MKSKTVVSAILLIFVAASVGYLIYKNSPGRPPESGAANSKQAIENTAQDKVLVVYFFHGRARCASCKIIEAFGKKALETGFPEEMKSGRIVWRDTDLDEPENQHFVQDYQILSISLVLSDTENGAQKQWKNLDEVWDLLDNEKGFVEYVKKEAGAWL